MTSKKLKNIKEKVSDKLLLLKVLEAYTKDVGKGVARIDYDAMDVLGVTTGDILGVTGKRSGVAKCFTLYPSDEGKGIIRIDGLERANVGAEVGDSVNLTKVKAVAAQKVVVGALAEIPPIDERYLADALESIPLIKGDNVMVPYFGGRLSFQIIDIIPTADAAIVTQRTLFTIIKYRSPQSKKLDQIISKINKKIEKEEKKLLTLTEKAEIDTNKITEIFTTIKELEKVKKHFEEKM